MDVSTSRPAILFDLDGTLTDPFVGITKSIQYALEKLGRIAPAADDLQWCIGPPIRSAFMTLVDTDEELVEEGVRLYRERYSTIGMLENRVIDGIPEVLEALASEDLFLAVATSKLGAFAEAILDHFNLRRYFQAVYGSESDGRNSVKGDLIRHILANEPIEAARTIMIGDRSHDIVGARANGIAAIGVLWGYGDRQELEGSGAAGIAERPEELPSAIRSVREAA
jgi:phosphoglycolate phosphatase